MFARLITALIVTLLGYYPCLAHKQERLSFFPAIKGVYEGTFAGYPEKTIVAPQKNSAKIPLKKDFL